MKRLRSRLTDDLEHCFICGMSPVQIHHCIGGCRRKLSDSDGLVVPLCLEHHLDSKNGVHGQNTALKLALMRQAQTAYEKTHSREEFMARYGKNYL